MSKPTRVSTSLFGVLVLLTAGTNAGGEPAKESVNPYEQTRNGITVRVEKIGVEQIFNVEGWLRKQDDLKLPPNFELVPFQVVHVFVSVIVDEIKAGKIKNTRISFELAESPPIVSPVSGFKWGSGGRASFDPPMWQKQLPDIEVDPKAKGFHFHDAVSRDARIEDLFPAELKYTCTIGDDKEIEILFSDLKF